MLAVLVATLIQRAHDDASGGRGELDEVTEASNTPFDDKGQREPTEPLVGASAPRGGQQRSPQPFTLYLTSREHHSKVGNYSQLHRLRVDPQQAVRNGRVCLLAVLRTLQEQMVPPVEAAQLPQTPPAAGELQVAVTQILRDPRAAASPSSSFAAAPSVVYEGVALPQLMPKSLDLYLLLEPGREFRAVALHHCGITTRAIDQLFDQVAECVQRTAREFDERKPRELRKPLEREPYERGPTLAPTLGMELTMPSSLLDALPRPPLLHEETNRKADERRDQLAEVSCEAHEGSETQHRAPLEYMTRAMTSMAALALERTGRMWRRSHPQASEGSAYHLVSAVECEPCHDEPAEQGQTNTV